ncbi:amino acid permease [Mycobacterium sp. CVI_P3]|uniref:Amino acid permease n=1 Tax=Mycobacterium pinniadriaticum TaxID=2994102 RepID=A0ABT3SLF1_9MYCO|nr:amino acid permease [Mycobacterium pinniadriaticum]MCX2933928.1 amino acid permease [Mycobacterium pinniadriaticum]MCX2940350.1 amino acid permease [Mycobacterium pinniadriaticum]
MKFRTAVLGLGFAFTVMADPVSSVAYAIEAALRGLEGDLSALIPTMGAVVAIIAVISATYHELIGRFPGGGGGPEAIARAFGEGWAFIPLGALLVDFTLTVAVSCAAGASALIAYLPQLESYRTPIGLGLVALVAGVVLLGQGGRVVFAVATMAFIVLSTCVIVAGISASPAVDSTANHPSGGNLLVAGAGLASVLLAIPLGMALATGVESPSNAIAQLPQLGDHARRRLGRQTLWLMVAIVGTLTICFTALAVKLRLGIPAEDSTLIADMARRATGSGVLFTTFQASSALLLLAAAASSYLAGSGVLKALATIGADGAGLVPSRFGRLNKFLIPEWGVGLVLAAAAMLIGASGREQRLVGFYAVAVFASFLAATIACARLSYRDGRWAALVLNIVGAVLVATVLVINARRVEGLVALLASAAVAVYLWRVWVARGRPRGVAGAGAQ